MLVSGRSQPRPRAARSPSQHRLRARRDDAEDLRERRDLLPLRGLDPRRRHLHRADRLDAGRPAPDGAADHDQRRASSPRPSASPPSFPWYFYVRQDKKSRPREPITAKLVADLLQTAGADRVLTMDLHAGQVQGFFEIPVDHMTAIPLFAQYVRDLNLEEDLAVVSPDTGHAKIAGKFAEMVEGDLVILNKVRPEHNQAKVTDGDRRRRGQGRRDHRRHHRHGGHARRRRARRSRRPAPRRCTPAPPTASSTARRSSGSPRATSTSSSSPTRSRSTRSRQPENIQVLSIASILAETILNVFSDDSVSAIFAGENQLF